MGTVSGATTISSVIESSSLIKFANTHQPHPAESCFVKVSDFSKPLFVNNVCFQLVTYENIRLRERLSDYKMSKFFGSGNLNNLMTVPSEQMPVCRAIKKTTNKSLTFFLNRSKIRLRKPDLLEPSDNIIPEASQTSLRSPNMTR